MEHTDWAEWHAAYDRPDSGLAGRLAAVRAQIHRRLDETEPGPVRVVSACAGDGRDLLGVLAERSDAGRVEALLVEADAGLAQRAQRAAREVGATLTVHHGDAAVSDTYAPWAPADLVLLCGIFGNLSDEHVRRLIEVSPQLCAAGAEVVWTRHRHAPDLTLSIRNWFEAAGFVEVAFVSPGPGDWAVGVHRSTNVPQPLEPGQHWFTFVR